MEQCNNRFVPIKRKKSSLAGRNDPVISQFLFLYTPVYCWRIARHVVHVRAHACFGRRFRLYPAFKNTQPASRMIFTNVIFHMERRVLGTCVRRLVNGRLKFFYPFLSPACACWRQRNCFLSNFIPVPELQIGLLWSSFILYRFWFFAISSFNWNWLYIVVSFRSSFFEFLEWSEILNIFGFKVLIYSNCILPCKFIINP